MESSFKQKVEVGIRIGFEAEGGPCCPPKMGGSIYGWVVRVGVGVIEPAEPGALGRLGGAPTHQPGFDLAGADIDLGELGQFDPNEADFVFESRHCFGGRFRRAQLFHMEHDIDFVMDLLAVIKALLGGQQQRACLGIKSGFLFEFTTECVAGLFGELNMPAGEVAVVVFVVSAHQYPAAVEQESAGDDFGGML